MPFVPEYEFAADPLPILEAAKAIIESQMFDALQWRANLDGSELGALPVFKRVQLSQRLSAEYPIIIIQPATDAPTLYGSGGTRHLMTFDVEIFITKDIGTGMGKTQSAATDDLTRELLRYYGAVRQMLNGASNEAWAAFMPVGSKVGNDFEPFCTNAVFGELTQSVESAGLYMRSVAFELQVQFTEAQSG